MSKIEIRTAADTDAKAIVEIYNYYVTQTIVTFEEAPVSSDQMRQRICKIQSLSLPWLVAKQDGKIVGYAYAGKWKERLAYRFSAESTVYVALGCKGQGIGSRLYGRLLSTLKKSATHCVMGGIALPNKASVALHEKYGFAKAAHLKEVGFKFNQWIDVGYWQLIL